MWYNSAGAIHIIAVSTTGAPNVDAAGVLNGDQIAYVAFCDQQDWINVAEAEQAQAADPTSPGVQEADSEVINFDESLDSLDSGEIIPNEPGCSISGPSGPGTLCVEGQ